MDPVRLLAGLALCLPALAWSAERNDIPSCYAFVHMTEHQPKPSGRELVVVVDQTTQLSADLRDTALRHALRFMRPGDSVLLYEFSAFLADNYMRLPFAGFVEAPLEGKIRNQVGMDSLRKLDKCLAEQRGFFVSKFTAAFTSSVAKPDTNIAKSEIVLSLRQIGADLSRRPVPHRVVLLVSDMLENSDFGSFYANNAVRTIDPGAEMKKIEANKLLGDFSGADVYIHGAGLVTTSAKDTYRSGKAITALEQFWHSYFQQSKGTLKAFGAPALTVDLQ